MPKSSGGSGSGNRKNSGGGGGGSTIDMTTPVDQMNLETTIQQITKFDKSIKVQEADYARTSEALRNARSTGTESEIRALRQERSNVRNIGATLNKRRDDLIHSIGRGEREGREVIWKRNAATGKMEKKDLGPFQKTWRGHFGIPRG